MESKASEGRERQDLGHMVLLGFWVECFGAKARLVDSNQKKLGFGKL